MPHYEYLFSLESSSEIARHFYCVLLHLTEIHRPALEFLVVRFIRFSRSALVPLHHGEVFLPRILKSAPHRNKRDAGSAMDEQKNRVIHVLAAHFDPLINAADADGLKAVDAVGRSNGAPFRNSVL